MNSPNPIRVLIVDDHFVVRLGLKHALNNEPDMEVIGEASTGAEALESFRRLQPDVTVLDMRLPQSSGAATISQLREKWPEAKTLIFSTFTGDEDVFQAFQAGALGYVSKMAPREDLMGALRAVAAGERLIPPAIAQQLAHRMQRPALSARESQVLNLIVQGRSNKEIGSDLQIAEVTVKVHVSGILAKLHVADRTQAATAAIRLGLVALE
jgi:DNA-binding NarL/FixJ family response regulator